MKLRKGNYIHILRTKNILFLLQASSTWCIERMVEADASHARNGFLVHMKEKKDTYSPCFISIRQKQKKSIKQILGTITHTSSSLVMVLLQLSQPIPAVLKTELPIRRLACRSRGQMLKKPSSSTGLCMSNARKSESQLPLYPPLDKVSFHLCISFHSNLKWVV